jgi:DNA-binding NarL/FixJ family response regulator
MLYDTYVYMLPTDTLHMRKIGILLADDHRVVREQLAARLRRETDFEVVGMASTSRETWQETQAKRPHVLLMDPIMRDGLGLATLRQIRAHFQGLVIMVLTAYVDTALNMQFQDMGIQHILTKGIASSQLIAELRAAYTLDRPNGD